MCVNLMWHLCEHLLYNIYFSSLCHICCKCVIGFYNVSLKIDIFKIIRNIIIPLINHAVDDALSVLSICPSKSLCIVINAVPYLPCSKVCARLWEVGVSLMQASPRNLVESVFVVSSHDDVKLMPCTSCILLCSSCHIVGDAILHTSN